MTAALAAVVAGRGHAPVPSPVRLDELRDDEVLVRIAASGICHTDLTAIDGAVPFGFPAVFGHEGAGVVEATGSAAAGVEPGDRVVLTFDSCGVCARCASGHPAYCEQFGRRNSAGARPDGSATLRGEGGEVISGSWMAQSSWATFAIARASNVVPIDDDVPFAIAAPLGCGVLTGAGTVLGTLRPGPGDRLVVLGAGAVGLSGMLAAHVSGCGDVVVVEPDAGRRTLALELGATAAVEPEELAALLRATRPADRVLDTVGTPAAVEAALAALASPGACATVALRSGANPVTVSQSRLLWGRSISGVIEGDARPAALVPMLARLWRAGLFPVDRFIRTFAFGDVDEAVAAARSGSAVKPVLVMDPADAVPPAPAPTTVPARLRALAAPGVRADVDELLAIWDVLPTVGPAELRGFWRGRAFDTGHGMLRTLERAAWVGKHFVSDETVRPIVCDDGAGGLVADLRLSRGGGASLVRMEHRGRVTATMLYDRMPVHDHFVRVDADTLLGVMAGEGTLDAGRPFLFLLERAEDPGEIPSRG
ncbi:alcohol dehydrogenase catalytic domain-containing protein [Agromyces archimandritae]|uniref:Alcohol dehydrogenase catalytic domain-containing protein n=1 Tax=Agromyces archimandritae TaxID=2781962 RepID=A0A975FKT2_9MICO|nr:alcohol dehydrogenase catalytic domain-containing protein [Agromyces archimandritae]QTX03794.1 alcohol dehydrogenase catalytic domain-containing protein [Agromyces archimandritae]